MNDIYQPLKNEALQLLREIKLMPFSSHRDWKENPGLKLGSVPLRDAAGIPLWLIGNNVVATRNFWKNFIAYLEENLDQGKGEDLLNERVLLMFSMATHIANQLELWNTLTRLFYNEDANIPGDSEPTPRAYWANLLDAINSDELPHQLRGFDAQMRHAMQHVSDLARAYHDSKGTEPAGGYLDTLTQPSEEDQ